MREITYKEAFYDRLAVNREWDQFANRYETERRLQLVFGRLLGSHNLQGSRFLDVGSGGGHFSAEAVARGAEVWSLDAGENLLLQVAARCESHRVLGSVLALPFRDETFDIVLSTEVIEHTDDPLLAIRELCRVVRKGGILLVTTPCRLWLPAVRLATMLRLRIYRGHEYFLWPWQLQQSVHSQGFEIQWAGGFNVLPPFHCVLDPFLRFSDQLFGQRLPWLMVNHGIMAVRP